MAAWIANLALPLAGPLVRWILGRAGAAGDNSENSGGGAAGGIGLALGRLLGLGQGVGIPDRARTHLDRALAAWQDEAAKTPELSDDLALLAARGLLGLLTRREKE